MARAKIQINGIDATAAVVTIGSTVVLSNDDEGGEITYAWSFVDQPEGTADVLSNATIENPTFAPTKEGTYLVRLVVNALLGTQAIQTATVAVLDARTAERVPAAAETTETGLAKGWALATNRMFSRALRASVDSNMIVASTPGSLAAGSIVKLSGVVNIQAGTQSTFEVTQIAGVNALTSVPDRLGILIDGVVSGVLGAGKLVLVRMIGLVPFAGGTTATVGDPVYLSDTGVAALTPGTTTRKIGIVVADTISTYRWVIDGAPAGGVSSLFTAIAAGLVGASGGGSNNFLRADGVWAVPPTSAFGQFGDGSDGVAVMDGTTAVTGCTLTNPGASGVYTPNRSLFPSSVVQSVGITFRPDGWPIYCKGNWANNGTVDCSGGSASGTTNGTPAVSGSRILPATISAGNASNDAPQPFPASSANNFGLAVGGAGGVGGNGTNGTKGRGGGGGAGGNNNPFTGAGTDGSNGPAISPAAATTGDARDRELAFRGFKYNGSPFTAGTWGGRGGLASTEGGAGAPGGWVAIATLTITGSGIWQAKGGNGGAGTAGAPGGGGGGGGGGGAGGFFALLTTTAGIVPDVTGGIGGAGGAGGTGSAGAGGNGGNGGPGHALLF